MTGESKPVLWVGLTSTGREFEPDAEHLSKVAEDIEAAVGDDYHVVVADDRWRLMDADELRQTLADIQNSLEVEADG